MTHILMFAGTRSQADLTSDAMNRLKPNCARSGRPDNETLKQWHDGEFEVLVLTYQNVTGFRAPDDTTVILLDGCPDEAHRIQAGSRYSKLVDFDARDDLEPYFNEDGN